MLHCLFGSRGPCQLLLQMAFLCILSGCHPPGVSVHCPRQEAAGAAALSGSGPEAATLESHAVLEVGKQQHLEDTSADLLPFRSRERLPGGRSCGSHTGSA